MTAVLVSSAVLVAGLMLVLWLVSIAQRDASIVDIAWGAGFVLIAWNSFALADAVPADLTRRVCLALLTTIWGLRLAAYIAWRKRGQGEDPRYAAMRSPRPRRFWWWSGLVVFGLQGALMWAISLPVQLGIASSHPRSLLWLAAGIAVWAIGLFFEAVGDWQLARFKSDPSHRGQVLDRGLWRYTRHPNYFGDCCVWWGLWLAAVSCGAPWWTVASPTLMTLLLLFFSGVLLLEKSLAESKPAYADYIRRTSPFLPWPPAKP